MLKIPDKRLGKIVEFLWVARGIQVFLLRLQADCHQSIWRKMLFPIASREVISCEVKDSWLLLRKSITLDPKGRNLERRSRHCHERPLKPKSRLDKLFWSVQHERFSVWLETRRTVAPLRKVPKRREVRYCNQIFEGVQDRQGGSKHHDGNDR